MEFKKKEHFDHFANHNSCVYFAHLNSFLFFSFTKTIGIPAQYASCRSFNWNYFIRSVESCVLEWEEGFPTERAETIIFNTKITMASFTCPRLGRRLLLPQLLRLVHNNNLQSTTLQQSVLWIYPEVVFAILYVLLYY